MIKRIIVIAAVIAGVQTASAQSLPRTIYFTDAYGNPAGSATTNPVTGQTVFNNQFGGYEGTANRGGPGQTIFNDEYGNYVGAAQGPMFGNE